MKCPKCSSQMEQRTRRSDGNIFWGCKRYPECRGTRPGPNDTTQSKGGKSSWKRKFNRESNPQLPKCRDQLPKTLSPTKAIDFLQCPRKYYESAISKRVVFQGSEATVKGNLVHHALEMIFKLPPDQRTVKKAVSFIEPHWNEIKELPENMKVSHLNNQKIDSMLAETRIIVEKWFKIENPQSLNPVACELKIQTSLGTTPMRGIIDRVDQINEGGKKKNSLKIIDYKTGKVPRPDYLDESLFQIYIYALAIEETRKTEVAEVELLYVTHKKAIRKTFSNSERHSTLQKFNKVWLDIQEAAETGRFPAKEGPLCGWCDAKPICPIWN